LGATNPTMAIRSERSLRKDSSYPPEVAQEDLHDE
jgi:hypothetical protein